MLLAAAGAFVPVANDFSGKVLARVNGKSIPASEVDFALERLADNSSVTHEKRLEVLHRLIDQELLIQRAIELGLLDSDRTVRKAVAMAVIDRVVADVLAKEPTEEKLWTFYASHQAVFTTAARIHVQQIYCGGDGDLTKALTEAEHAAAAIVHGMSFSAARKHYSDHGSISLPDVPLPRHVLQRYLGPTLTETALTMKVGEISPPLLSPVGYHILRVVDQQPEQLQPYEIVRQEVRAEYIRRERDAALQHFLTALRQEATVVLSPKAPRIDMTDGAEPTRGP